jgi:hypothetical protein
MRNFFDSGSTFTPARRLNALGLLTDSPKVRQYYGYYFFNWTGPPRQAALIFKGRGRIESHGLFIEMCSHPGPASKAG